MNKYEDIIEIKYSGPKKHKRMSIENRSAQFAPFAALTGYEEAVIETARTTKRKIELEEDMMNILNSKLQIIQDNIKEHPLVSITYFVKDNKKDGGSYEEYEGKVKNIDEVEQCIIFIDKKKIYLDNIIGINARIFDNYMIISD